MPELRNLRHERFCQEYVRGPHAGNATSAHEAAGFKRNRGHASKLANAPHIVARVTELRTATAQALAQAADDAIARTGLTIERLIVEMEEARQLAMKNGQSSAAVSAVIAKAKIAGLWVEKRDPANKYADLTDEQLEQRIRDLDAMLANG
jgi:phage terminase small subunit